MKVKSCKAADHAVMEMIQLVALKVTGEVSATLFRRGCQTASGCKRSNSAVVNAGEKALKRGQVSFREVTARESLMKYRETTRGENRPVRRG
jgi:hypothetical protein